MGMYDEVVFDPDLPGVPSDCRHFQTKSLERCLDLYFVTKAGRLCLAGHVLMEETPDIATLREAKHEDIDFHGDLRLVTSAGGFQEYRARFTDGTFQWMKRVRQ